MDNPCPRLHLHGCRPRRSANLAFHTGWAKGRKRGQADCSFEHHNCDFERSISECSFSEKALPNCLARCCNCEWNSRMHIGECSVVGIRPPEGRRGGARCAAHDRTSGGDRPTATRPSTDHAGRCERDPLLGDERSPPGLRQVGSVPRPP